MFGFASGEFGKIFQPFLAAAVGQGARKKPKEKSEILRENLRDKFGCKFPNRKPSLGTVFAL